MKYFNHNALLPEGKILVERIDQAAADLDARLSVLDVEELAISEYNKKYLSGYLKERRAVIERYAFVLAWGLASDVQGESFHEDKVLLDYGGGTGMMCLLAKTLGIKKVLYNDIYDVSCRDAREIALHLGLEADAYIHGEIDDVISHVENTGLNVDVLANNDVIEHIYDMEEFIAKLPSLSRFGLRVAMATGANPLNPYVSLKLMRLQWRRERRERAQEWGHKETEALLPFREIREGIIRTTAPNLTEKEVRNLVAATRGRNEKDIKRQLDAYVKHGVRPTGMLHPTNTCDPISSSWAEHLMNPAWVTSKMREAGFAARVVPGPYGWRNSKTKQRVVAGLDRLIFSAGAKGVFFSPFVVYVGKK